MFVSKIKTHDGAGLCLNYQINFFINLTYQRRRVGYRRPGRTAIIAAPKSREMPDAPHNPHFCRYHPILPPLLNAARGGPSPPLQFNNLII